MHSLVRPLQKSVAAGAEMTCWLNEPLDSDSHEIAVVLCSAFGRRMHHHSTLAQYLTSNGMPVLRFDATNHVGLSAGSPAHYTMTGGLHCLRAAIDTAKHLFPSKRVGVVATSLNARIALRALAADRGLAFLIGISGVVNVNSTLKLALGVDYFAMDIADLPPVIEFEGQQIGAREFYLDYHAEHWGTLPDTLKSVDRIATPVNWLIGERDDWIAVQDLDVFRDAAPEVIRLIKLEGCGHDVGRNPSVARRLLDFTVRVCRNAGRDEDGADVIEPPYKQLMQAALEERRLQRSHAMLVQD